jgi:ubiquinone/menaquinone biosynthesis C-methylase UbiE
MVGLITKADNLIGLDFSKNMIDLARKKITFKKVIFVNTYLNGKWSVHNNSFDLVTIDMTLEYIEVLDHISDLCFMKLSQGGKCFVSELHPKKIIRGKQGSI